MANDFKPDAGAKKKPYMYQNESGDMVEGSVLMGTRKVWDKVCKEILLTSVIADETGTDIEVEMSYTSACDAVIAFELMEGDEYTIDPKAIADFIQKNVRENGRMLMYFTDPTGEECQIWFLNELGLLDLHSLSDMDMDNVNWCISNGADDNNEIDMNKVGWIV